MFLQSHPNIVVTTLVKYVLLVMFHFILRSDGNVGGMARQQLQTNLQLSAVDKMMKINPDLSNNYAKVLYKLR